MSFTFNPAPLVPVPTVVNPVVPVANPVVPVTVTVPSTIVNVILVVGLVKRTDFSRYNVAYYPLELNVANTDDAQKLAYLKIISGKTGVFTTNSLHLDDETVPNAAGLYLQQLWVNNKPIVEPTFAVGANVDFIFTLKLSSDDNVNLSRLGLAY